DHPDLEFV
ncbi:CAI-1 autoinducer synthase, partial [Vibrio parahaemolyticus EKP-021]